MTTYGKNYYAWDPTGSLASPNYYGYQGVVTSYPTVQPFTANAINYENILLQWTPPIGAFLDFRLLRSRYGFPVDENDGTVLQDSGGSSYPGSQFLDSQVIPGTYHYYGVYILVQVGANEVWYRAGLAACLAPINYDSYDWLMSRVPEYYKVNFGDELTTDAAGNVYFEQFMSIFGWGVDYLKTALNIAQNVNNPAVIPINYLYNLALTLGFPFEPMISPATVRDAVANASVIFQQRGTLSGIEAYIENLTSWGADLKIGHNLMLEQDQSAFADPVFPAWNSTVNYAVGEQVTYENYTYVSNVTPNLNHTPSGTSANNTQWNCQYYLPDPNNILINPNTGWPNTWEPRWANEINEVPGDTTALQEELGIMNPLVTSSFTQNGLRIRNNSGSSTTLDLCSVSRIASDITAGNAQPDPSQVIGDGIPVPFTMSQQAWSATTEYVPGDIVTYNSQPFEALKASTNIAPPTTSTASNEWQPLGLDSRISLFVSAYNSNNMNTSTNGPNGCQMYVNWYDESGTLITKLTPRNTTAGTAGIPPNLLFNGFSQYGQWGSTLDTLTPDVGSYTWVAQASTFSADPFSGGCVFPTTALTRTEALVNYGSGNANTGVTLLTDVSTGWAHGIVGRWSSDSNYWRVSAKYLKKNVAGTLSTVATHSTAFSAGDRMTVSWNGSVITVYRNGTQVSTATDSFNSTATYFGIIYETA